MSTRSQHAAAHRSRTGLAARWVAAVLASVLALGVFAGSAYAWYQYRALNTGIPRLAIVTPTLPPGHVDYDGPAQNILLVGNDERTGLTPAQLQMLGTADAGSVATDTMMLLHIPSDGSSITGISLPREAYADVPGYGTHLLNSAYADGWFYTHGTNEQKDAAGASLVEQTVENLTGVKIDHFVSINLIGFLTISAAVGGVPVDLCNAVHDTYTGIDLPKGVTPISGKQALAFVRQRHGTGSTSDLTRIQRQQYFLTAAFRQVASLGTLASPSRLSALITAIKQSVQIDEHLNLLTLATQVGNLSANNIRFQTIPLGEQENLGDGDGFALNVPQVQAFIKNLIVPPPAKPAPKPTGPAAPTSTAPPSTAAPSPSGAPADAHCVN